MNGACPHAGRGIPVEDAPERLLTSKERVREQDWSGRARALPKRDGGDWRQAVSTRDAAPCRLEVEGPPRNVSLSGIAELAEALSDRIGSPAASYR
jgi:hypothetical protein